MRHRRGSLLIGALTAAASLTAAAPAMGGAGLPAALLRHRRLGNKGSSIMDTRVRRACSPFAPARIAR
jgi:hypothetical protein